MNDRDWEIIRILHEKRSITQAASELFITQSALTKRIHAIEDEFGAEVILRSSKGITFTEAGSYLFQKALEYEALREETREHFSEHQKTKTVLRLGVPNSFARLHMAKAMKAYKKHGDNLFVQTISNSSDITVQQLIQGSVDAGIICGDFPFLGPKTCLIDEELYLVAPKDMEHVDIEHAPYIESYYNPIVKMIIDQWWMTRFGHLPKAFQYVPYSDIAIDMVQEGLGICFLFGANWSVDHERVQTIPLYDTEGNRVSRKVWLMWNTVCRASDETMEFIDFLADYFAEESQKAPK